MTRIILHGTAQGEPCVPGTWIAATYVEVIFPAGYVPQVGSARVTTSKSTNCVRNG